MFELLAGLSNERVQQKIKTRTRCIMILFFQLVIGSMLVELLAMSFFLEKGQQQILTFFSGKLTEVILLTSKASRGPLCQKSTEGTSLSKSQVMRALHVDPYTVQDPSETG